MKWKNIYCESKVHTGHIALLCDNSKPCGCKDHHLLCSFDNIKFHFRLQLLQDLCLQVLNMWCESIFYIKVKLTSLRMYIEKSIYEELLEADISYLVHILNKPMEIYQRLGQQMTFVSMSHEFTFQMTSQQKPIGQL